MISKMEVLYCGEIWLSNNWINQSMFKEYTDMYPKGKILIFRGGTILNVENKDVKKVPKVKKERRKNEQSVCNG